MAADPSLNSLPLWFGLAFMIVGIAFKFGACRFTCGCRTFTRARARR